MWCNRIFAAATALISAGLVHVTGNRPWGSKIRCSKYPAASRASGWGAFPLVTSYWVQAGSLDAVAALGAAYAIALSYAQRRLSTWVRGMRRRAEHVSGEVRYADGSRLALDRETVIAAPEAALRWLAATAVAVSLAALATRL